MTFWQYVFRFLYVRNWHTGRYELDKKRVYWFSGALLFLLVTLILVSILLTPIVVEQ